MFHNENDHVVKSLETGSVLISGSKSFCEDHAKSLNEQYQTSAYYAEPFRAKVFDLANED